jgi:hypothetical protein
MKYLHTEGHIQVCEETSCKKPAVNDVNGRQLCSEHFLKYNSFLEEDLEA